MSARSTAKASVDLPEPDNPVNQTVRELWPRREARSSPLTCPSARTMLRLAGVSATEVAAVAEHLNDGGDAFFDAQNRCVEAEVEGLRVVVGC